MTDKEPTSEIQQSPDLEAMQDSDLSSAPDETLFENIDLYSAALDDRDIPKSARRAYQEAIASNFKALESRYPNISKSSTDPSDDEVEPESREKVRKAYQKTLDRIAVHKAEADAKSAEEEKVFVEVAEEFESEETLNDRTAEIEDKLRETDKMESQIDKVIKSEEEARSNEANDEKTRAEKVGKTRKMMGALAATLALAAGAVGVLHQAGNHENNTTSSKTDNNVSGIVNNNPNEAEQWMVEADKMLAEAAAVREFEAAYESGDYSNMSKMVGEVIPISGSPEVGYIAVANPTMYKNAKGEFAIYFTPTADGSAAEFHAETFVDSDGNNFAASTWLVDENGDRFRQPVEGNSDISGAVMHFDVGGLREVDAYHREIEEYQRIVAGRHAGVSLSGINKGRE